MLFRRGAAHYLIGLLLVTCWAGVGHAQTWNNFTSAATGWSVASNWVGGVAPVSSTTTSLIFGSTPNQAPPAAGYQPAGGYTATLDSASAFIVNSMTFNGFGACDVNGNGIIITNTVAAGGISFQGTTPQITQNGTGSVQFANGPATSDIVLTATGLTINGSGIGHVSLNGVIGGTGPLTINQSGATPMFSGAQVLLAPGAANTFTGAVNLTAGNLAINNTTPFGNAANVITINGGTLRGTSAAPTVANPVTLTSQLTYVGTLGATFTGAISGNGGIRIGTSASAATVTFQNTIGGTGAINVEGQGFALPTLTLASVAGKTGSAKFATSITASYGEILVDNTAFNSNNRLNSAGIMNLNSGTFTFLSSISASTTESVGTLNLNGGNVFNFTPATTHSLSFTATTLNRLNKATFEADVAPTSGLTLGLAPNTNGNANLLFSNLNAASNINGVLPFGFAATGINSTGALVRYDPTNGVVQLNPATDFSSTHPYIVGSVPTTNWRVSTIYGGVNNNITANSVLIETPSDSDFGSGLYGSGTLSLTSGVIGTSTTGGPTSPHEIPVMISPNLAFGGTTGYLHAQTNSIITGNITGSNGFVKSGQGFVILAGDNSGLTGGLTINAGIVSFDSDNNLGAPGGGVTLSIEQGTGFLNFLPSNQYRPATTSFLSINRPITIANAGGGGLSVAIPSTTLDWAGNIGGSGRLFKFGFGILSLSGNNNFTGDLVITNGTVIAANDAALGAASAGVILGNNTIFQPGSTFATSHNFLLTGLTNNTIFTAGNDLTINGNIGVSQLGAVFTKAGLGNLTLTSNNSVNGNIVIGDATAIRRPSAAFAQPGGTLTLSGLNGALAQGLLYTFNQGATVVLDNSVAVNQDRIASKQIKLAGAVFQLIGNSSANVVEHVGATNTLGLTNTSFGNTITLTQPASILGQSTTLVATSYTTSATSGIAFFRGTNLGAGSGDRTSIILVASPTLINNVLPQALIATSASAAPQDFATVALNAVVPFSAYVALPASGSATAITYSLSGPLTLTGAANGNALKIANGTLDMGANTMTLGNGAGMVLSTGTDVIGTSSGTVPDLAFGAQAARITVNNTLSIGSVANPVRVTTSAGLNKFGQGTLSLSSANVSAGDYQVSQGTLRFLTPAAFTNGAIVTVLPGATLDTNGLGTIATPIGTMGLAGFGTVAIGGGAIATGATNSSFGGGLSGTGALIQKGALGQTLNGNSPGFSGDVYVNSGSQTNAALGLIIDANVVPSNLVNPGPLGIGTTAIQLGATSGGTDSSMSIGTNVTRFERDINVRAGSAGFVSINGLNGTVATITSNITLNRQLRLALGNFSVGSGSFTFTGTISGGGSLQLYGGQIALWGNNNYSGGTLLEIDAAGHTPLGIGNDHALGSGPARYGVNFDNTLALRADNGDRTLPNNFTIESDNPNIGIGYVGKNSITLNGTFDLNTTGATGLTRTFNVETTGNAVVTLNNTVFNSTAPTGIIKDGGGTLVLGGSNTYTGDTTLQAGVLGFGSSSVGSVVAVPVDPSAPVHTAIIPTDPHTGLPIPVPQPAGPIGLGTLIINAGTLRAVNGDRTVSNHVTVGGDFAIDGSNALTLGGAMNLGSAPRSVVVTNSAHTTFGGVITSAAGSGLIKMGSGYLAVTNDNTYTGNTLIADGSFWINNLGPGSGTSLGAVTVKSGAKLGGFGVYAGMLTVNAGGTLAPGASIGTLTATNNTSAAAALQSGANWEVEFNHPNTSVAPVNGFTHDFFRDNGTSSVLTLGSTLNFVLSGSAGTSVPYTKNVPVSYTVATFNNSSVGAGVIATGTTYTFNTTNFFPTGAANVTGYLYSAAVVGNNLVLTITPVPEPATVLAICGVGAGMMSFIRRRRTRKTELAA
jgi:fibronectin-binding autotransporter adhesin